MYKGLKATDAEMVLDFKNGTVVFDYSLNKFARFMSSNNSCCLHKENVIGSNPIIEFLKFEAAIILNLFLPLTSRLVEHTPKYQYLNQKLLKFAYETVIGNIEETIIGKQDTRTLKFNIDYNLWFDYELDGDYQDKLIKISLLRRFIKKTCLGRIKHIQRGWNVIFEFTEPPQHGYVTVRSGA